MTMIDLEEAKQNLRDELENMPHTRNDLLGNAACGRKIRALIVAQILDGATISICIDEMKSLMLEYGVIADKFNKEIIPEISVYYKAKELIDNGYCDDLKG